MRWIDRGPEPQDVQEYDRQLTSEWVRYVRDGVGQRPAASCWREFRALLGSRSGEVCWYCERRCMRQSADGGKAPTVDHFRPLSRYPELAYQWRNWIFSCRRCNGDNKGDKWPEVGFVDPGAAEERDRPEEYLDYDADTGEIVPRVGLSSESRERALQTIDSLGLNKLDVRFYRLEWTRRFIADLLALPNSDRPALAEFYVRKRDLNSPVSH